MRKRLGILLLAATLVFPTPALAYDHADSTTPFEFTTPRGITIRVGDSAWRTIRDLGDPISEGTVKGSGKYYIYSCYTIYTNETGDNNATVTGIAITADPATTEEGLDIGMLASNIEKKYDRSYKKEKMNDSSEVYQFQKGGASLSISTLLGKITAILFGSKLR